MLLIHIAQAIAQSLTDIVCAQLFAIVFNITEDSQIGSGIYRRSVRKTLVKLRSSVFCDGDTGLPVAKDWRDLQGVQASGFVIFCALIKMRHQGNKEFADLVGVDVTQLRDVGAR